MARRRELKHSEPGEVADFANTWRGRWIISEALSVAIDTLSELPLTERPTSDINDMIYLRDGLFCLYEAVRTASPGVKEEGEDGDE